MNVYLIKDGGDDKCWLGESMQEAVKAAEDAHVEEERLQYASDGTEGFDEAEERAYYQSAMLQSCTLVGELGAQYESAAPLPRGPSAQPASVSGAGAVNPAGRTP